MAFLDYEDDIDYGFGELDEEGFVMEHDDPQDVAGIEFEGLTMKDYCLDAPIINDHLDEFISQIRTGEIHNPLFSIERSAKFRDYIRCNFPDLVSTIQPSSSFANWWPNWSRDVELNHIEIDTLLDNVNQDAEVTYEVLESFLKGWIGKESKFNPRDSSTVDMKTYGTLFLTFHKLIICFNSSTKKEKDILISKRGWMKEIKGYNGCYQFLTNSIKESILFDEDFILFPDQKRVLSRNQTLMLKDLFGSRFQALISVMYDTTGDYDELSIRWFEGEFKLGDRILIEQGDRGYDCIKMVEPLCNLRLMETAHGHRPLLPISDNFRMTLETKIKELSLSPASSEFLDSIMMSDNVQHLLALYGMFRLWGHPSLFYLEGLEALYKQTHSSKTIDDGYAQTLASDLAKRVLKDQFDKTRKWFVNADLLDQDHLLKDHILNRTWPTQLQIDQLGQKWHELPLTPCFQIPDFINPSGVYSDKSHSIQRSEVLEHVSKTPWKPIPSRRVLKTFLDRPSTRWKEFLREVDEHGFSRDDCVIGLRGKERELKRIGRFFALMSWKLREYFVITEFLIKEFYVPLFKGLTMADDLTLTLKKILDNSWGQGINDYKMVTYSNHIDYDKWNNHQRYSATRYVFRVMGQFLGYPSLIERTHEIFESSLIYYNARPDLMIVEGDSLINKDPSRKVCWEGQPGGLEGLRQKGWSVLNLLIILREAETRNTEVGVLAQGDNQVICTRYKPRPWLTEAELIRNLQSIHKNNTEIMDNIIKGTKKLGLIINTDETMESTDYLTYGKIPVYRGNIMPLKEKRWSRVLCTSNDQLPSLQSIMSTVNTNALTVSHYSDSPITPMIHYNWIANFVRLLMEEHNPALKMSIWDASQKWRTTGGRSWYLWRFLYLDPSLGGITGGSLSRFLIRGFPDPLTESLSFWKLVYQNTENNELKRFCLRAGDPRIKSIRERKDYNLLAENPLSLNIPAGLSYLNHLRESIKRNLQKISPNLENQIIKESLNPETDIEDQILAMCENMRPLFPRFISEFKASTICGIKDSMISLVLNSRTIRVLFKKSHHINLDFLQFKSELATIKLLLEYDLEARLLWPCSSTHADILRQISWGPNVVGTTIPHPLEILGHPLHPDPQCSGCQPPAPTPYVTVLIPRGLDHLKDEAGPYRAYLGSKTKEKTSVLQPWEQSSDVSLIRKALKIRDAISWFISKDSNLARSILNNLKSLTGLDWSEGVHDFLRTGSALHRFSSSRQSSGGFLATSPAKARWIYVTTDTMNTLEGSNHDFMYQSLILYSQITSGEMNMEKCKSNIFHFHVRCQSCIREIHDIEVDSLSTFDPPDFSHLLRNWMEEEDIPVHHTATVNPTLIPIPSSHNLVSYFAGLNQAFFFSLFDCSGMDLNVEMLFPIIIADKVLPFEYLRGITDGVTLGSALDVLKRRKIYHMDKPKELLTGTFMNLSRRLSSDPNFLNLLTDNHIQSYLISRTPNPSPSYPASFSDTGLLFRSHARITFVDSIIKSTRFIPLYSGIISFSDFNSIKFLGPLSVSYLALNQMFQRRLTPTSSSLLREISMSLHPFQEGLMTPLASGISSVQMIGSELRHVLKGLPYRSSGPISISRKWREEYTGTIYSTFLPMCKTKPLQAPSTVKRVFCPLMSGMRLFQFATGSHMKIRCIIKSENIKYQRFLTLGDGSGGITAFLLRSNSASMGFFNSLLDLSVSDLKGAQPSIPSALSHSGPDILERCLNAQSAWHNPSDLSQNQTWEYLVSEVKKGEFSLDLVISDFETTSHLLEKEIIEKISSNVRSLLSPNGVLIVKSYWNYFLKNLDIYESLGSQFKSTKVVQTDLSSLFTSEIYIIFSTPIDQISQMHFLATSLDMVKRGLFAERTFNAEFDRSLSVTPSKTWMGVPKDLIPDPIIMYTTILSELGVDDSLSLSLSTHVKLIGIKDSGNLALMTTIVSLLNLTPIFRGSSELILPPSDQQVTNMSVLLLCFILWYSRSTRNRPLFKKVTKMFNKPVPFSCLPSEGDGMLYWSFDGRHKIKKYIYILDRSSDCGRLLRGMFHIFGEKSEPINYSYVINMSREFNKSITQGLLEDTAVTTILDPAKEVSPTFQTSTFSLPAPLAIGSIH